MISEVNNNSAISETYIKGSILEHFNEASN